MVRLVQFFIVSYFHTSQPKIAPCRQVRLPTSFTTIINHHKPSVYNPLLILYYLPLLTMLHRLPLRADADEPGAQIGNWTRPQHSVAYLAAETQLRHILHSNLQLTNFSILEFAI